MHISTYGYQVANPVLTKDGRMKELLKKFVQDSLSLKEMHLEAGEHNFKDSWCSSLIIIQP